MMEEKRKEKRKEGERCGEQEDEVVVNNKEGAVEFGSE